MAEVKYIGGGSSKEAARYLYKTGLLFELNRKVLHPLGLALSVNVDEETDEVLGFAGLWDSTADPEGLRFTPGSFNEGLDRLAKYLVDINIGKVLEQRRATLGYIIQMEDDCNSCVRAPLRENDATCKACSVCVGSTSTESKWEPG